MKRDDFLVEIRTEELPPTSLWPLSTAFCQQLQEKLHKANLTFEAIQPFATPRRLAVLVKKLDAAQPDQLVERKGPALNAAFDAQGKPSPACLGFARSCGVSPDALKTIKTPQGEWVGYRQKVKGKSVAELLPEMVEQAALALPISKRMRWGDQETQFVRPVHSVVMLYGKTVVKGTILGCQAGRVTQGHRFLAPKPLSISQAGDYEQLLEDKGRVIADFAKRRDLVRQLADACVHDYVDQHSRLDVSPALLDEVTALVEWPSALCGKFDREFLQVPQEVLISSMEDHQRYFPVLNAQQALQPYFVTISNVDSKEVERVIHGNERVLRARLSDAAFFFHEDQKERLDQRVERLKTIVYQAKLGTLHDKTERIGALAGHIAEKMGSDAALARRAGLLSKTDLTTAMVGEFPELQGVMGGYYAEHDGESAKVARALRDYYKPRFAGDSLVPATEVTSIALALADRIDTLVGAFGIHQIPTGDKDPYGLRRAAIGILRYLTEATTLHIDLKALLEFSVGTYQGKLENPDTVNQVLAFIIERLRAWYQEKAVTADVFASVAALNLSDLRDIHERIKAVEAFKKLEASEALSVANKRVSNILKSADAIQGDVDTALFEDEAEKVLDQQVKAKKRMVEQNAAAGNYEACLMELASLRQPVDNFFDHVMVMTEDKSRQHNRILLLNELRKLFLHVADIALLQ